MILLESQSRILEEVVRQRIVRSEEFKKAKTDASEEKSEKREAVDVTLADFDGVQYHVSTDPTQRHLVTVSIQWSCIRDLAQFGLQDKLKAVYGNLLTSPEPGYDFSLQFNLDALPTDKDQLPAKISQLKRHIIAVPFEAVFDAAMGKGSVPAVVTINYRSNEALFLKREGNNVTAIFSINFKDKDDIVIGKVFLQELELARRTMHSAPSVMFSQKERPLELKGVQGVYEGEDQGFVSFVLFGGHIHPERRAKTIDQIHLFRNYLHYHIKCSKAFLHTRMRLRVEELLQVLNRAKMKKANKEMKTMSGRTFKRA